MTAVAFADLAESSLNISISGTAGWDAAVATKQRYVTREPAAIAPANLVESLGPRRPRRNRADLSRMMHKISGRPAG